ncbi:MAG: lipase family protein [Negativicoccus massiliensis]|nr:lipase family protein [Negativicoccus massiliensis]
MGRMHAYVLAVVLLLGIGPQAWAHDAVMLSPFPADEVSIVAPNSRSAEMMSKAGVNSNEVLLAAYASLAAYQSEWSGLPVSTLQKTGWQVIPGDTGQERFIIASQEIKGHPYYVVAISGTERKVDLKANLRDDMVTIPQYPEISVHQGYWEAAQRLSEMPQIREAVASTNDGGRVIFTGHSLGGGVATLIGLQKVSEDAGNLAQMRVITFAAPDFVNSFGSRAIGQYPAVNFRMEADLIPSLFRLVNYRYHSNPNSITWSLHTPSQGIPHTMIGFLDEAFYQAAWTFSANLPTSGPVDIYVAAPALATDMGLSPRIIQAYRNTAIYAAVLPETQRIARDYREMELSDALATARARGAKYLLWLPLAIYPERESTNRNYGMALTEQWWDVDKEELLTWESVAFRSGGYTIFTKLADYLVGKEQIPVASDFLLQN